MLTNQSIFNSDEAKKKLLNQLGAFSYFINVLSTFQK